MARKTRDKDWSRITVGGSTKQNNLDRIKVLDGFHTPIIATDSLAREINLSPRIWECANGHSRISDRLAKRHKRTVFRSDIHRWVPETQMVIDFTKTGYVPFQKKSFDIVTNPPFVRGQDFVENAMNLLPVGGKLCLLLRLQFLEGGKRAELFKKYPPVEVLVFSRRLPRMHRFDFDLAKWMRKLKREGKKPADPSSAMCFCWFI